MINRLYIMVNNLFTVINQFFIIVYNLYIIVNKLFTKKMVFLLIVLNVDIKLNKNTKVGYFCTKPQKYWVKVHFFEKNTALWFSKFFFTNM